MDKTIIKAARERVKLYAEGNKLHAEGNKLYAEGNKLRAEGDLVFLNAVIAVHGGGAVIGWRPLSVDGELVNFEEK